MNLRDPLSKLLCDHFSASLALLCTVWLFQGLSPFLCLAQAPEQAGTAGDEDVNSSRDRRLRKKF